MRPRTSPPKGRESGSTNTDLWFVCEEWMVSCEKREFILAQANAKISRCAEYGKFTESVLNSVQ